MQIYEVRISRDALQDALAYLSALALVLATVSFGVCVSVYNTGYNYLWDTCSQFVKNNYLCEEHYNLCRFSIIS